MFEGKGLGLYVPNEKGEYKKIGDLKSITVEGREIPEKARRRHWCVTFTLWHVVPGGLHRRAIAYVERFES